MLRRVRGYLKPFAGEAPEASTRLERDGYAQLTGVFDAAEIEALAAEINQVYLDYPRDARADAVRSVWETIQVPQCGYCQSGQIMTAVALLQRKSRPTDDDIDAAMNGNVCRCATYVRIREAIHQAARKAREARS